MNAVEAPNVWSTSAASAGPTARPAFCCVTLSRTAERNSSGGTRSGISVCHVTYVNPTPTPEIATSASTRPGDRVSVLLTSHKPTAASNITTCAPITMRRRENRSAIGPAIGDTRNTGKRLAKTDSPTQVVEWVMSSTTNGTVIVCIHEPMLETTHEPHNVANRGWRNGDNGPGARPAHRDSRSAIAGDSTWACLRVFATDPWPSALRSRRSSRRGPSWRVWSGAGVVLVEW